MTVVRILSVVCFGFASLWLGESHSNEAFFTAAAMLLTYVSAEAYSTLDARTRRYQEVDKVLYHRFIEELPFHGAISFLRDNDLRVPFERSHLNGLARHAHIWSDEAHRFHDKTIHKSREHFSASVVEFLDDLAVNTFPTQLEGARTQEIPREWRTMQPERYMEVSARLDQRADTVVTAYEAVVSVAKRRLRV